jgi:aminopeptidase YwaD
MRKKLIILFFLILISKITIAQDITYARKVVDTLTSPFFWGRGYTNDGMGKTATYLANQFSSFGLKPLNGKNFLQKFSFPVNTFPAAMEVSINGSKLKAGSDFIVSPESIGKKGKGILLKKDSITYLDTTNKVALFLKDKLTWSVAQENSENLIVLADKKLIAPDPSTIEFDVVSKLIEFEAFNVCGIVKGTKHPDSLIIISAHYDHLGGMGKEVYFPGANDNASGVSLLLGLARYYSTNPQPYSIAFIGFAGEEAGLLGSKYFTENPYIPLSKIRFLINVDMVGTGEEGITVVNATHNPKEYSILTQLNFVDKYLSKINLRGKAANSDHYWFAEKGVPAFFIYTLGGVKSYHDVFDVSNTLPLNEYEDIFKLILKFNANLME